MTSNKKNSFFSDKNIIITGATGYLGSTLLKFLQSESPALTVLYRNSNAINIKKYDNIKVIVGDLLDCGIWEKLLVKADYVFHLAGLEYESANFDHALDLQLNFLSVVNLLRTCDVNGLSPKIVFTSSSNIAKDKRNGRVSELDKDDPMSFWSLHKLISEKYLNYYSKHRSVKAVCVRLPNVYGPPENLKSFTGSSLNSMIIDGIVRKGIKLYSNSGCLRDFLYIDDAVKALMLAAEFADKLQEHGHYYVGSDEGHSYFDLCKMIEKYLFSILKIKISIKQQRDMLGMFEMRSFVSDSNKFRSTTGFFPETGIENGIKTTILRASQLTEIL